MGGRALTIFIATGCGTGRFPIWPGTFGSLPPLILAYMIFPLGIVVACLSVMIVSALSIYYAGAAEKYLGHDARSIVIDEWAGMTLSLLFLPVTPVAYLIAFLWFRLFDVLKLPPAIQAERLPGGWGVTCDDLVAGVQANLLSHATLWLLARLV